MPRSLITLIFFLFFHFSAYGQLKIKVFVGLCDNETQGIAPVGKSIGDGNKPEANLYWGCSDGLPKVFGKSKYWKLKASEKKLEDPVMRTASYEHVDHNANLEALAYRGAELKQCFLDYEKAVSSGEYDLVCFIGHNALMDFTPPEIPKGVADNATDVIVLCCLSDRYFSTRTKSMGAEPVLMTRSLMYPGAFILHDVFEKWFDKKDKAALRLAAGKAYHKNQVSNNPRLTLNNALTVFEKLAQ